MTKEQIDKLRSGEITSAKQIVDPFAEEYGVKSVRLKYVPPSLSDIRGVYVNNETLRKRAISSSLPFITSEITDFKLSQGLIIIAGKTGQGKSTTLANILAGFMENKAEGDKALVITNEESTASVYNRVACVMLRCSFKGFYNGTIPEVQADEVSRVAYSLMDHIVVEEGNKQFDMTDSVHVKSALEYAAEGHYKLACLDYVQTVTKDSSDDSKTSIEVSKDLGFWLKGYSRKVTIPVIVFAQLHPSSEQPDFASRIQNDRTIVNHAFVAIEVLPDFDTKTTKMIIQKDRFSGCQGKEFVFGFDGGRLVLDF